MIRSLYKRTLQLQIMTRKKLNNFTITYLISSRQTKHERTNVWSSATSTLKSARKERKEFSVLLDLETERTADPCYLNFAKKMHHLFTTNTWMEQKESARHIWTSPGDRCRNQIDFDLCNRMCRSSIQNLSNKKCQQIKELKKPSGKVHLRIKDKDGKLLHDADILNSWTQYIGKDLFNDERPEQPRIDVSDNLGEITTPEVVKAIPDLARNKSPSEDVYQQNYFKPWGHLEKRKSPPCEYRLQGAIEKSGILINGVKINKIRYAEDTVILAETEKQLQAMLDRSVDKCK
ncbi:craniofacial development protein 2-like [Elysia marginata]|uniref:Craniofacial development protein 2-like n=1 Tax=Elysia marginata TaxID=1093978 RepID=A0AAV4FXA0_9GAST|nr:craniofacial development protein 2-like [Elysia marginata]